MFSSIASDQAALRWREIDRSFLSNDLPVAGYGNQHPLPPNVRLNHILLHPSVVVRASDLGLFITYTATEDLKTYFPVILETIFGFKSNIGWGLRMMTKQNAPREVDAVLRFLSPYEGQLINLTYRLMEDTNLRYEYPVSSLPKPLADRICSGDIPSFFSNKINAGFNSYASSPRSNISKNLQLNPFEYYFTIFCMGNIFGVSGEYGGNYLAGWGSSADSVYSILFEEYLAFFFPCDGQGVPAASYIHYQSADTPYITSQSPIHRHQYSPPRAQRDSHGNVVHRPSMFKESVFEDQGDGGIITREKAYHAMQPYAQKETWRSDTILHLCMELWMNVEVREDLKRILFDSKLPSVDLVKSIRMLVRHVHYFINNTNTVALHPMEDIKRQTYPIFQKKLYIFLKDLFQRWPMDNSFRIVYETWLSYVQPWRYLHFSKGCNNNKIRETNELLVDNRWYNFMLENILFYTTLCLQLLPRFQRADLTTPKNALMLYRVAKVYTISENVKILLREVEKNLDIANVASYSWNGADMLSHPHGIGSMYQRQLGTQNSVYTDEKLYNGVGLGSPNQALRVVHVKQMLKELESPQFVYTPLFSQETKSTMKNILVSVHQAAEVLRETAEKSGSPNLTNSWSEWFKGLFRNTDACASGPEKARAYNQLEFALHQLSFFFDIPQEEIMSSALHPEGFYGNGLDTSSTENFPGASPSPTRLSSVAHKILPPGLPMETMMTCIGNPDESLPRQDENRFALRMCSALSKKLNAKFGRMIEEAYFEKSCKGKICRTIFARPQEYYIVEKRRNQRPIRIRKYLPPRVCLRALASYKSLYVIFGLYVAVIYFKFSSLECLFWGIMLVLLFVNCRVLREPSSEWEYLMDVFSEDIAALRQPAPNVIKSTLPPSM